MIRKLIILLYAVPFLCGAQVMPYCTLKTLQDCADSLQQMNGVTVTVKVTHVNPKDDRGFNLSLKTSEGERAIPVGKDGSFRVPELPKEQQQSATVVHSLKKGDLRLSLDFGFNGELPHDSDKGNYTIFEECSVLVGRFKQFEHVFVKLEESLPGLNCYQIAAAGITCPRERPSSGKVLLKNGDKTVASADLAQTGPVTWMFDEFDPKIHRLEFEMSDNEPAPKCYFVCKYGADAVASKNAIFFRKTERSPGRTDGEIVNWLREAAERGDAGSQYRLGLHYMAGRGMEKEAAKWLRKAAEQNNPDAQYNLANCYERGRGVPKHEAEAYKWALVSAAQGNARAKTTVSFLELLLSQKEIVDGKQWASNWIEHLPPLRQSPVRLSEPGAAPNPAPPHR